MSPAKKERVFRVSIELNLEVEVFTVWSWVLVLWVSVLTWVLSVPVVEGPVAGVQRVVNELARVVDQVPSQTVGT